MNESTQDKIFELDLTAVADFPDFTDSFFSKEEKLQPVGEKFIVFMLDDKQYGVSSSCVSEVIRQLPLTTLPNIPEWFLGIANLRGDIISVVDLQKLWNMESTPYTPKTKLIVLRCAESDSLIAFKVDKLREIVTLSSDSIEASERNDSPYLLGQAKYKSGNIELIDVENFLCSLKLN